MPITIAMPMGMTAGVQSRDPAPVDDGTPFIDGITVEDVEIRHLAHAAGVFLGLAEAPIRNIAIRNLTIVSRDPVAVATPPIMADGVRPMLHEGSFSNRLKSFATILRC